MIFKRSISLGFSIENDWYYLDKTLKCSAMAKSFLANVTRGLDSMAKPEAMVMETGLYFAFEHY